MKKLLSLPPNLVGNFHDVTGLSRDEYFCTNDPVGHKLGSGGGTTWLLEEAWRGETARTPAPLISRRGLPRRSASCCTLADRAVVCPVMPLLVRS